MPVAYLQQPYLLRASKTFTGAANLGAVGVNELFTTTGEVVLEGFWVSCTTTLSDTVDGAVFTIGTPASPNLIADYSAVDLDSIVAGVYLGGSGVSAGYGDNIVSGGGSGTSIGGTAINTNITMDVSTQAITGGVLEFYVLWRPLSADGNLAIGAGMVAI